MNAPEAAADPRRHIPSGIPHPVPPLPSMWEQMGGHRATEAPLAPEPPTAAVNPTHGINPGRRCLWRIENMGTPSAEMTDADVDAEVRTRADSIDEATVIGSLGTDHWFYPVIDIDHPCQLVETETPGHYHLAIDVAMDRDQFMGILEALTKAGVVEAGYTGAAQRRGDSFVSVRPWKADR